MLRTAILPRGITAAARNPLLIVGVVVVAVLAISFSTTFHDRTAASIPIEEGVSSPPAMAPAPEAADFAGRGVAGRRVGNGKQLQSTPAAATASAVTSGIQIPSAPDAMIIRNGYVVVEVDSLERAIEQARRLALSLGGSVGNVSMNTGERQVRSATIELKVPAARFDEAMTGLAPIGEVEQSNATAQDVGEEFVDITARVSNAKRLEQRLINLLATRTGRLEDVLAVERELARVREEIERYEGRLRYLSTRAATSTIVASLHEEEPLIAATPGTNVIGQAFKDMWRNFVRFIATGIESLGLLVPLAVLAWLGWRATRRWRTLPALSSDGPVAERLPDTPA